MFSANNKTKSAELLFQFVKPNINTIKIFISSWRLAKVQLLKLPSQASEDAGLPPSDLATLPLTNTPELVAALEQVFL